ncbi:MAG: hypothetical protein ACFWUJ_20740 [Pseudomonas fragi]
MSEYLQTALTDALGCRYPIVQTAMGWVADANLVIASTRAGAFGFLAGATIAADQLEAQIQRVIEATGGSNFGLNFHMFQDNAAQCVDLAIEYRLRAVSYGRGPDRQTIDRLKRPGCCVFPLWARSSTRSRPWNWALTWSPCRAARAAATPAGYRARFCCHRCWMRCRCR